MHTHVYAYTKKFLCKRHYCCASCSLLNWSGLSGTRPKEWAHAWSGLRAHNSDSVSYKSFSVLSQMMICGLSWFLTFLTYIPSWKLLWCAQKHTHVHVAFLILQARLMLCISWGYINQISVWAMCCSKATNSVNYLTTHTHARARTDACIYAIQTPLWNSEILERGNLVHSAAFAGIRPQEWQELGAKEE